MVPHIDSRHASHAPTADAAGQRARLIRPARDVVARRLVEVPVSSGTADALCDSKAIKGSVGEIEIASDAAHALIDNGSLDGLALVVDGDGLSAEGVSVALLAHELVRERDDLVGRSVGGLAAGAEPGLVEGDVARAGGAGGALAVGGATAGGGGGGGGASDGRDDRGRGGYGGGGDLRGSDAGWGGGNDRGRRGHRRDLDGGGLWGGGGGLRRRWGRDGGRGLGRGGLVEDAGRDGGLGLAGDGGRGGAGHGGGDGVALLVDPDGGLEHDGLGDIDDVGDDGVTAGVSVVVAVGLRGNSGEEHGSDGDKAVLHDCGVGVFVFWFLCVLVCMCDVGDRLAIQGLFCEKRYLLSYLIVIEGMCDHRYTGVEPMG